MRGTAQDLKQTSFVKHGGGSTYEENTLGRHLLHPSIKCLMYVLWSLIQSLPFLPLILCLAWQQNNKNHRFGEQWRETTQPSPVWNVKMCLRLHDACSEVTCMWQSLYMPLWFITHAFHLLSWKPWKLAVFIPAPVISSHVCIKAREINRKMFALFGSVMNVNTLSVGGYVKTNLSLHTLS